MKSLLYGSLLCSVKKFHLTLLISLKQAVCSSLKMFVWLCLEVSYTSCDRILNCFSRPISETFAIFSSNSSRAFAVFH